METHQSTNTVSLLDQLKTEMPEVWSQAQVVGRWVWLEFSVAPEKAVRAKLRELGFHWNKVRQCWQHPCGQSQSRPDRDPREVYPVVPASAAGLNDAQPAAITAKEFKVVSLREFPLPESMHTCETPQQAADYWRLNISSSRYFDPERECFATLLLNTRNRVKGHHLVSIGTMDTILVSPISLFHVAVVASAAKTVLMHNHPSGLPQPSEADIKVTRDLIRAGQLLKVEVLDHVIVGAGSSHCSLRELGYFAL